MSKRYAGSQKRDRHFKNVSLNDVGRRNDASAAPVDFVVLNEAAADLVHRVRRDGRVVVDRDRAARLRFEVQHRNEYSDLEPIGRAHWREPTPSSTTGS